jgi:two-component system LytT family response regulator
MRKKHNKKSNVHLLHNNSNYLLVGSKHKGKYIKKDLIAYIEACENYSWIYLVDGSKIISSKTIGHYEKVFSAAEFTRIHRSYLINLTHLKCYEPSYRLIHLKGEFTLPVSHRKNRVISKMLPNGLSALSNGGMTIYTKKINV